MEIDSLFPCTPSGNQNCFNRFAVFAVDESEGNEASDPLVGRDVLELPRPDLVVHVLFPPALHRAPRIDESLEGVRQVIGIGEVEAFALENLPQPLHVGPILLVLPLVGADELHLGELIDFVVEDLSDQDRVLHRNQVLVDFHLDDAIDCFGGHLLEEVDGLVLADLPAFLAAERTQYPNAYISMV